MGNRFAISFSSSFLECNYILTTIHPQIVPSSSSLELSLMLLALRWAKNRQVRFILQPSVSGDVQLLMFRIIPLLLRPGCWLLHVFYLLGECSIRLLTYLHLVASSSPRTIFIPSHTHNSYTEERTYTGNNIITDYTPLSRWFSSFHRDTPASL